MSGTSVEGRVVAVTGAARGIGREIALELARRGAQVALGDRDLPEARVAAAACPGTAAAFDLDVTDTASFSTFLTAVQDMWGPVDVLVNNAGVMWVGAFDAEPESAAERMLAVNLHGVIRGVKAVAPGMRARGRGHIVTVASAASKLTPAGEATYAASKHGVLGYLGAVREELHRSGVTVSVVMPAVVETELSAGTGSGAARMLQPSDVARAVVAVVERPRFETTVPRLLGPVLRWANLLPQAARDVVLRRVVPNQVHADRAARERYESSGLGDDPAQAPPAS